MLYSLAGKFSGLAAEDQVAAVALREAIDVSAADCGWVALFEGEAPRIPESCCIEIRPDAAQEINRHVLQSSHVQHQGQVLMHSLSEDSRLQGGDVPARFLAASLPVGGISLGYLCLGRRQQGRIFTSADQKLMSAVASLMAVELENVRLQRSEWEKQRLTKELDLARKIQQLLLPQEFSCTDFLTAAAASEPCYEIGGDFFDLISIGADRCLLVIADVTGKGAPAALQAALIQGIIQGCSQPSLDPSCLMTTVNRCLIGRAVAGKYPTAYLATLDRNGRLCYTNGGHLPAVWIQSDGRVLELDEGGPLLGLFEDAAYPQGSAELQPGDLVVLYTDGVTDAEDGDGQTFGRPRLLEWAHGQPGRAPAEVKTHLLDSVRQFCGASKQADDLTVLVTQYTGPTGV